MNESQNKWWVLTAMCLLTAILNIDVSGINVAIPTIATEFHANLTSMQWVINIYVLMSAAFQILGGRLGDTFGHKKVYLIGCLFFILSSLGAGLSYNEFSLILFRTLQGISLGIAFPITIALTLEAFPKSQQGFALGFIVTTMGSFLALGPILGGIFVHSLTWRWIFYINVPIGFISFFMALIFCKSRLQNEKKSIDYLGAFLLTVGLLALIIPLNQLQIWTFHSIKFWLFLGVGLLFLFLLYLSSKKKSYPIFEFKLFKIRNFTINNLLRIIVQLVFIPVLFFIPIYLQNIAKINVLKSGLIMLFLTLSIAIGSPIAGKWVDKVGDKFPNTTSMMLYALACFFLIFTHVDLNIFLLAIALILVGLATAIAFVSTVTGSMLECETKMHGIASGVLFTIAWLGCALGVSIMGSIIAMSANKHLRKSLHELGYFFSNKQIEALERVSSGVSSYKSLAPYFSEKITPTLSYLARKSFVFGFKISMIVFMGLSLIGILLSLFLKKIKPSHPSEDIAPPI